MATMVGKDAAKKMRKATDTLQALAALLVALDSLDIVDIKGAKEQVRTAASEVPDKVKDTADGALKAAKDIVDKLDDAKIRLFDDAARKRAKKQLRKEIKGLRQSILENATTSITAADYIKARGKVGLIGPIAPMPGCFAIATYKKFDFDKDLTDYTYIYIGKASNASDGVDLAISRDGDPDVYADVKYGQNVHIYVYNCLAEELEERYSGLIQAFEDSTQSAG